MAKDLGAGAFCPWCGASTGSGDRACRECGRRPEGGKRRPPLLWWLVGAGGLALAGGGITLGLLLGAGGSTTNSTPAPVAAETSGLSQPAVTATTAAAAATSAAPATGVVVTSTTERARTTTSTVVATAQGEGSSGVPVQAFLGADVYLRVSPSGTSCSSWNRTVSPSSGVVRYLGCFRWQPSEPGQGEAYDEFTFRASGIGHATVTLSRGSLRYTFAITVQR